MPLFVHLAPESARASIFRGGIRGTACTLEGAGRLRRAVFAFPILPDYSDTFQWVRELRRWHDQRLVAVRFRIPDGERVYAGRFGKEHTARTAAEAVAWVRRHPAGAEVAVPRPIGRREIRTIHRIPQMVGWAGSPEETRGNDCLCPACLPSGMPNLHRKLKGALERWIAAARAAGAPGPRVEALSRLDLPLERARRRLPAKKLLSFAGSEHAEVRREVATLLRYFHAGEVEPRLWKLAADPSENVRKAAVSSLIRILGLAGAAGRMDSQAVPVLAAFIDSLVEEPDEENVGRCLERWSDHPDVRIRGAVDRVVESLTLPPLPRSRS